MKNYFAALLLFFALTNSQAQTANDTKGVTKACLGYLEGFYEGDTTKLINSLRPTLNKFGFWKNNSESNYEHAGYMSFTEAKAYARNVLEKKKFPKEGSPKKVEVLSIGNHIAAAKVTAWWGIDYLLLSREGDKWMIEQVLWEGPFDK